ncbi:hypothetical protein ACWGLF_41220 [Streptomyces puniciscabiei]
MDDFWSVATASARGRLRRCVDNAVLYGERWLLDQAVSGLGAAGGRLRHSTESRTDTLSDSERQAPQRLALEATNQEIAEALFLTRRARWSSAHERLPQARHPKARRTA